eukprot:XP_011682634.1 PREDICTED: LOW QUALITY PROTEIN: dehydrogenase/reductase SDR family member 7B [Strongylocentrotus purpuratus]
MSSASSMNSLTVATAAIFGSLGLLWLYKKLRSQRRRAGLKDKVVLITGASSGVGEACAIAFYRLGCKVILCARRAPELERVKKELMGPEIGSRDTSTHTPCHTLRPRKTRRVTDKAKEALALHGHVDILINNGGMSGRGSVAETVLSVHQKIMNVNHFGSLVLTSAILPNMISRRSGHILAVSSIQGRIAIPFRSAYSASKHAMQAFFDSLRAEVAEHNIQVTVLSPSYIKTNISLSALDGDGSVHAKMDSTTAGGMSTVYVADKVVDAVAKQQRDVVLGPFTHGAAIYIRALVPNLYFWIMAGRARKGTKMED